MKCIREKCKKLKIEHSAGGITYKCDIGFGYIILGEIAHWANESDYPKPVCEKNETHEGGRLT